MWRSSVVKNVVFVIMVVSCYMTFRIMIISNNMDSSVGDQEYEDNKSLQKNKKSSPRLASSSHDTDEDPLKVKERASLQHNTSHNTKTQEELVCSSELLGTPESILKQDPLFRDITCDRLLHGANMTTVYDRAAEYHKKYIVEKVSDEKYIDLTQDCQKFKMSRGYHIKPGTVEEEAFPIAYNILIHKDLYQVEMLLRAIYRPQNVYCIHLDAKQDDMLNLALRKITRCFNNIFVASKLERIVYAGFTRLQADINCMKDHLQNAKGWKYLLNIAGQSFPLRTNLEMVKILKVYNGANDIEGIFGSRIHKSRFEDEWKEVDVETNNGKLLKTGNKNPPPPFDMDIVRGSAYGIFSRDFVQFIIHDEKAQSLLNWSRNTWSPDEHYWATLHHTYTNPHLKTPGGYNGKPDEKPWLAVWVAWGGKDQCHGMWARGTCVFGVQDLPNIITHPEFFVNKFYYNYQPLTLECLNNWIEHKVRCPRDFDISYYKKLTFIKPRRSS